MKYLIIALIVSSTAFAGTKIKTSKLKTNHDFGDKLVNGKYQYPDEANARVDDEKELDDLIGVRKNFKDRLKESAER